MLKLSSSSQSGSHGTEHYYDISEDEKEEKKMMVSRTRSVDEETMPSELPHIDEQHSFWSEHGGSTSVVSMISRKSSTKMFGKYFDQMQEKRDSVVSHNSIWSESQGFGDDEDDSDHSSNDFVLAGFEGWSSTSKFTDIPSNNSSISNGVGYQITYFQRKDYPKHTPRMDSLEVPSGIKFKNQLHSSEFSFASSVSLGSELTESEQLISPKTSHIMTIAEDSEIEQSEKDLDSLINSSSLIKQSSSSSSFGPIKLHRKKTLKNRKYDDDGKEICTQNVYEDGLKRKRPPKLLKIDSLLLDPDNRPPIKHVGNFSLDSFLSDMDVPEPTATEKLKYHLTQRRLPPSRRRTYNFSHHI